jgi:hypothetical protein
MAGDGVNSGEVWVWQTDVRGLPFILRAHTGRVNAVSTSHQRADQQCDDQSLRVWSMTVGHMCAP